MRTLVVRAVAGATILVIIAWGGQYFGHKIPEVEKSIAALGVWAPLAFLVLLVTCTSFFVSGTLFAILAGSLFGLLRGSIVMTIGVLITASLNFWMSRRLLRGTVTRGLAHYPRLAAIENAASDEGVRLLLLLRLTPIPAVSLNYALGASRVKYGAFFISAFAMIPMLIVEVYFGYLAAHLAKTTGHAHSVSTMHTALLIIGFATCVIAVFYIARLAKRVLVELNELPKDERNG